MESARVPGSKVGFVLLMTGIDYHYQIEQNLGSQECSLENFPRDSF